MDLNASRNKRIQKNFGDAKYVSLLIKNDELLEKYNEIWDRVSNTIKKGFDSQPVYNEKYLRTITSYERKISTSFHDDKYQKKVLNVSTYR